MTHQHRFGVEFIDLKKSVIDEEKSNKKKGVYLFKKKVLYDRNDNPKYAYKWVQTRADNIQRWTYAYQAEFVKAGEEIYPAPLSTNADGNYQLPGGDLVLMRIPIDVWLDKKMQAVKKSDKASRQPYKAFEKMTGKEKGARLTKIEKEQLGL